ncbi:HPP family protein [Streptomyces sp. NPDC053427]|uniref:HPP family protein n=1 Tax=Streptomyces sp. NPDC053427 TaxID=3365701 RepID=UPI0037D27AA7
MSTDQATRRPRPALVRPLLGRAPAPPAPSALLHATGASISILLLLVTAGAVLHEPILIPPLAATAALVHSAPTLPLAQPRSVIGGHLLSALTGLLVQAGLGHSPWAAALAGGLALGVMMITRTPHSPAAATAVIIVLQSPPPVRFLTLLCLATVMVVVSGVVATRTKRTAHRYPAYWW